MATKKTNASPKKSAAPLKQLSRQDMKSTKGGAAFLKMDGINGESVQKSVNKAETLKSQVIKYI